MEHLRFIVEGVHLLLVAHKLSGHPEEPLDVEADGIVPAVVAFFQVAVGGINLLVREVQLQFLFRVGLQLFPVLRRRDHRLIGQEQVGALGVAVDQFLTKDVLDDGMFCRLLQDLFLETAEGQHKMDAAHRVKAQILLIVHNAGAPLHRQIFFCLVGLVAGQIVGDILGIVGNLCGHAFSLVALGRQGPGVEGFFDGAAIGLAKVQSQSLAFTVCHDMFPPVDESDNIGWPNPKNEFSILLSIEWMHNGTIHKISFINL